MSDQRQQDRLPVAYALIWKATLDDRDFVPSEFEARIPRLMAWLRDLQARGKLLACGGGGFESHSGGLTIVRADSIEEAQVMADGSPMNEIGSTELLAWDIYFGQLHVPRDWTPAP